MHPLTRSRRSTPRPRPARPRPGSSSPSVAWPPAAPRPRARAWSCRPPCPTRCPTAPCSASATRPTQTALEASGLDEELDIEVEWANISGGPQTLEAFRADALDIGSVADIPPIFAHWTGTDIKIVAARETVDPLDHPIYELGIAPGVDVDDLADLRGKKIAYSPGQAQGALVLRVLHKAGLTKDDVELVELPSTDDVYVLALGSKQVDVAPLGAVPVKRYLAKYGKDGATTITPGVRDDAWTSTRRPTVLEDADKAAALQEYVEVWAQAQRWIDEHPEEFAQATTSRTRASRSRTRSYIVDVLGDVRGPDRAGTTPSPATRRPSTCSPRSRTTSTLDVADLYDRRYEKAIADALGGVASDRRRSTRPLVARPGVDERRRCGRRLGPGRRIPFGFWIGPLAAAGAVVRSARPPGCSTSAPCRRRGPS